MSIEEINEEYIRHFNKSQYPKSTTSLLLHLTSSKKSVIKKKLITELQKSIKKNPKSYSNSTRKNTKGVVSFLIISLLILVGLLSISFYLYKSKIQEKEDKLDGELKKSSFDSILSTFSSET